MRRIVRSRRSPATKPTTLRRRIGLARLGDIGGEFGAEGDQDDEAVADWVECCGGVWAVSVWDVVEWEGDGVKAGKDVIMILGNVGIDCLKGEER